MKQIHLIFCALALLFTTSCNSDIEKVARKFSGKWEHISTRLGGAEQPLSSKRTWTFYACEPQDQTRVDGVVPDIVDTQFCSGMLSERIGEMESTEPIYWYLDDTYFAVVTDILVGRGTAQLFEVKEYKRNKLIVTGQVNGQALEITFKRTKDS